jgi:hypothetical protein
MRLLFCISSSIIFSMRLDNTPTGAEIDAMTDEERKVLDNKLRRAAARHGLKIEKSRVRDPRVAGFNTYRLVDGAGNAVTPTGAPSAGLTLAEIARALLSTPMAALASALDDRGYKVSLRKSHGGQACRIHEDADGTAVAVDVVDFGRDPIGREVDIRWVAPDGWHFIESPLSTNELAKQVIDTLPRGPVEWRDMSSETVESYETYGGGFHYTLRRAKGDSDGVWTVIRWSLHDGVTEVKEESAAAFTLPDAKQIVLNWEFERKLRTL